jgi:hypothetical protein
MICMAMFGSGVRIAGMRIIKMPLAMASRGIPSKIATLPTEFYVEVRGMKSLGNAERKLAITIGQTSRVITWASELSQATYSQG